MTAPHRVLLVSRVVSPFQVEVGEALRALGVDYHIVFANGGVGTRPAHWQLRTPPDWIHIVDVERRPLALWHLLESLVPGAVVYGGYRGLPVPVALSWCGSRAVPILFWLEQMSPTSALRAILREQVAKSVLRRADAVLCVGPRAMHEYARITGERTRVYLLPYGQDLRANLQRPRVYREDGPVSFLFSGKYLQRNNIWEILRAMRGARRRFGEDVRLVLSGYAGAEREVTRAVEEDPLLRAATTFDVGFETWEDRLRPFEAADVLLMPGIHSGWGLVVPEAMSLGMPVISSDGIEAARFLVRDGVDGFLVAPTAAWIEPAMARFVEDRGLAASMGKAARERARIVSSEAVASTLLDILRAL